MLHRLVVPGVQAYLGLQAQQAGLVSCLRHFAASPAIALDDQASPSQPSTSKGIVTVTVACVLERLPVVERRLPDHVLQAKSDLRRNEMARGNLKDFATISQEFAREGKDEASSSGRKQVEEQVEFQPVPCTTRADAEGNVRTMKRQLSERLFLLVKHSASNGSSSSSSSGSNSSSISRGSSGEEWGFPQAVNTEDEGLKDTARRALQSVIGRAYPVFYIGNAPMGHFSPASAKQASKTAAAAASAGSSSSSSSIKPNAPSSSAAHPLQSSSSPSAAVVDASAAASTPASAPVEALPLTAFMLAQVTEDPWLHLQLLQGSGASDYAWVTKAEVPQYIKDKRLQKLMADML